MIAATAARLAASPRGRVAVLFASLAAAALLTLSSGGLAPAAARGALAAVTISVVTLLARRRARRDAAPAPLEVVAREPLAAGAGVAVVQAGGRRLLVGFGRDGVRLVADLGALDREAP